MTNNRFIENFINEINQAKENKRKKKKLIIFSAFFILLLIISISLFVLNAFADNDVKLDEDAEGREYLYFEIDHTFSNAKYKYYGYGYTVSLYDRSTGQFIGLKNNTCKQVFLPNSAFTSHFEGSKEKVEIYIEKILEITGVEVEYFWSENLTIYLNGRLGIKVDNKLVHLYDSLDGGVIFGMPEEHETGSYTTNEDGNAPLNGDGFGIRNALPHYYGVNWSEETYKTNLPLNFNIKYDLKPSAQHDGIFVEYKYEGKRIGHDGVKYQNSENNSYEVPLNIPPGYTYNGNYEKGKFFNRNMVSAEAENIILQIKKASKSYTPVCHHIVVHCDKLPTTGEAVNVDVEYRLDDEDGEELLPAKTVTGYVNTQFNLSSEKIDDYLCKKYIMIGQAEHTEDKTVVSVKLNSEKWNTPVNKKLKVIFIYEEVPVVVIPQCEPIFYGIDGSTIIDMKMSAFEALSDIYISNASFGVKNVKVGLDENKNPVEGEHKFSTFDYYVYSKGRGNAADVRWDNVGYSSNLSFSVPKYMFSKVSDNLWRASVPIDYVGFCSCKGAGFDVQHLNYTIDIKVIENKPPKAKFVPCTEIEQTNGYVRTINDIYMNFESTIKNYAGDPNGIEDIEYIHYSLIDSNDNRYYIKLNQENGIYVLDDENISEADNINFIRNMSNGDLKLEFRTTQTWTINQLVRDLDGLQDIYTDTVTPKILDLKPIAKLSDINSYRYPSAVAFSGKENRVVGLSSSLSEVSDILKGTGVVIDHSKDKVEIIPLDEQGTDCIYFENNLSKEIVSGYISLKNCDFTTQKLMFKKTGRYKIRLQVTDTDNRASEWTEEILTVVDDMLPTATATISSKNYRSGLGVATVTLRNINVASSDNDYSVIEKIQYRYDSNNDGVFTDEALKQLTTASGMASFTSNELGKYQFVVTVKESFGQPTIEKYINENDYKRAEVTFLTEIDNIAPDVIKFEIKRKDVE